jgi:hypothetical protein
MLKADSAIAYHDTRNLSLTVRPYSSGEPDAGNPPVRFGGRGDFNTVVPTPILHSVPSGQKALLRPVHKNRRHINKPFRRQLARRSLPEFQTTGRSREDENDVSHEKQSGDY